jgi:hypothetical protein
VDPVPKVLGGFVSSTHNKNPLFLNTDFTNGIKHPNLADKVTTVPCGGNVHWILRKIPSDTAGIFNPPL